MSNRDRDRDRDRVSSRDTQGEPVREHRRLSPQNVMSYYKSFSKKPSAFREMYESDNDKYSSSDGDQSSSSDDFPTPSSPRRKVYKRDDEDYGTLFNKVNEIQRRLYHVELKQRKKVSTNRK